MEHFGMTVLPGRYGLELNRETYAIVNNKNTLRKFKSEKMKDAYTDDTGKFYTDEWCSRYRKLCLKNFDLNMKFFSSLSHEEFEFEISQFLEKNEEFKEIFDLNEYEGVGGYYIMTLDKYCQLYLGTSNNIKKRIRRHWTTRTNFDRLLFPMFEVEKSVLSIDSFRALDTTRIFVYETSNTYNEEDKYIKSFSEKFLANRIGGGKFEKSLLGILQMCSTIKTKNLI